MEPVVKGSAEEIISYEKDFNRPQFSKTTSNVTWLHHVRAQLRGLMVLFQYVIPFRFKTLLGVVIAAFVICMGASLVMHAQSAHKARVAEEGRVERLWRTSLQQLGHHVAFMAKGIEAHDAHPNLFSLSQSSPFLPREFPFSEHIAPKDGELADQKDALRITAPLHHKDASFVIDVPLENLAHFLGVGELYPRKGGPLHGPTQDFDYSRTGATFWYAFLRRCLPQSAVFFSCILGLFSLFSIAYGSALLRARRFKQDQLESVTQELSHVREECARLTQELGDGQAQKNMQRRKAAFEKGLSSFIEERKAQHIDKLLALATLLSSDQHGTGVLDHGELLEALMHTAKQLQAGEVEPNQFASINMGSLLAQIKEVLEPDLLRAEASLSLDVSLCDFSISGDEKAMQIFMLCFFKDVLGSCFKGASVHVTRTSAKDASLSVEVQGEHVSGHVAFLEKGIVIGASRLSQRSVDTLREKLGISWERRDVQHILTFHDGGAGQQEAASHQGNVVPLFA